MEIYKTNNSNIFYTFLQIDNKKIELDFVLTVKEKFYCNIFIQNKSNLKNGIHKTVQQYNFKIHNFIAPKEEINKYLTNRQIDLVKKGIKKAYMEILKIKFEKIIKNKFFIKDNELKEYENYRKYIDYMI